MLKVELQRLELCINGLAADLMARNVPWVPPAKPKPALPDVDDGPLPF